MRGLKLLTTLTVTLSAAVLLVWAVSISLLRSCEVFTTPAEAILNRGDPGPAAQIPPDEDREPEPPSLEKGR